MSRKGHRPEEIVAKLRQVEVLTAQGRSVAEAIRSIGVTEVTPGRAAQRRGLLHAPGGQDHHRGLAQARQHDPSALVAGLRPARPRGHAVAGCAPPASSAGHPGRGAPACHALTFDPDHFMGAGHALIVQRPASLRTGSSRTPGKRHLTQNRPASALLCREMLFDDPRRPAPNPFPLE